MSEGCKDASALLGLGFNAGGFPNCKMDNIYARLFSGVHVILVPDLDIPGQKGAQSTGGRLSGIAASIRIARLPGEIVESGGDDVRDILSRKDGEKYVLEAIKFAEPWRPSKSQKSKASNLVSDSKLHAKTVDPHTEAKNVLDDHRYNGLTKIVFWGGGFLKWTKGKFDHIPNAEARTLIVHSLNKRFSMVGTKVVSDVLEQVKAEAVLSCRVHPPSWLTPHQWKPEDLITTENAIVHLPSFADGLEKYSIPSSPALFTTSALDYAFEPQRPACPNWLNFLNEIWPNDPNNIATLQEWIGYCLTPDTRQQKILLMIGQKRSGKGTICRVIRSVLGEDNVCGPTLSSLQTNFGLWPLIGKPVAIVSDARISGKSDQAVITERLLSISGEDAQTIDRKNMEPLTTKLSTRFMIVSNELPRLQDSSGAFTGRMIVLKLTESFYGREDHGLTDRLLEERAGILHWAIDGWKRLRERGRFEQPDSGRELLDQLNELSSPILSFVDDRCELGEVYSASIPELYKAWCQWCQEVGREPSTTQTFGRDLTALLPKLQRRNVRVGAHRERRYEGIRLVVEF
jgi:putative DNA primase/helicase